jgi:hypothetical protein
MRILLALTLFAAACGGTKPKKESALVNDTEQAPTCCCKTLPPVAEKDIVPSYEMKGRMECSSAQGECVDDVQCNATQNSTPAAAGADGVPPPPTLEPSTTPP